MNYRIAEEPLDRLPEYGSIPIGFEVVSLFRIEGDDPESAVLREEPVPQPWFKDYDADEGEGPTRWQKRRDVSNWGLLAAYEGDTRIGGCVLAHKTEGLVKLEGRDDITALWDLRVLPKWRGKGAGRELFRAAVEWASERNCSQLKIETQNINVAACRFYEKQGCRLAAINRGAYHKFPDEVELIWTLELHHRWKPAGGDNVPGLWP